jgi:hypothetical protein
MENIPQLLVLVAVVGIILIAIKVIFSKPDVVHSSESQPRNKKLIDEARKAVALAYEGDALAGAAVIKGLNNDPDSDFQGLINITGDEISVTDPSGPQPLEWHIQANDEGTLGAVKLPRGPLLSQPPD